MTDELPLQLLVGHPGHGVVDYASELASALTASGAGAPIAHAADAAAARTYAAGADRTHVHVTDRLFGRSPEEAADNVEMLAALTRLTITAHDVPQTSDGRVLPRRVAAYSRFFAAAEAVAVNSRHEQRLVSEFLPASMPPHAIPLGARGETPRSPRARRIADPDRSSTRDLVVVLAGYVYPGKGHAPAIRAAADAARMLRSAGEPIGDAVVRALGRASPGHESDVTALIAEGERRGVRFEISGFLDDAQFARRMADDGIPLAAHEHVSASRSMLDWVEAGRRPLVVRSAYADEMAALRPGTMSLYDPSELAGRLVDAWRDSAGTWLDPDVSLAPTLVDAGAAYRAWWAGMTPR